MMNKKEMRGAVLPRYCYLMIVIDLFIVKFGHSVENREIYFHLENFVKSIQSVLECIDSVKMI